MKFFNPNFNHSASVCDSAMSVCALFSHIADGSGYSVPNVC